VFYGLISTRVALKGLIRKLNSYMLIEKNEEKCSKTY